MDHQQPAPAETPAATALVMAGSRKGVDDPVARLQGKSHKCLVEIDGVVMLERVISALIQSGHLGRIFVSIENEAVLRPVPQLAAWLDESRIAVVPSRHSLAASVLAAADQIPNPFPLFITTGDNALHTAELIGDFMRSFRTGHGDVAVAFTRADVVKREFPDVALAYHQLKDGGYSACNLYGLRNARALDSVRVFEGGGQFGKRHLRILKAFGITPFLLYKLKLATAEQLMRRVGRNLGVTADVILLDYAYGPIDVDNPEFFAISERALRDRRLGN